MTRAIDVFLIVHALLQQAIGDVVTDGERIEERTLLEDHADVTAEGE